MKFDRITLVAFFVILCAGGIIWRLFFLQVIRHNYYKQILQTRGNYVSNFSHTPRGNIYVDDPKGSGGLFPIAIDKEYYEVFAVPSQIDNPVLAAELLSPIFDIEKKILLTRF